MALFNKLKKNKDAAKEEKPVAQQSAVKAGPSLKNVKVPTATDSKPEAKAAPAKATPYTGKLSSLLNPLTIVIINIAIFIYN